MNLHGIASRIVAAVNPPLEATVLRSIGLVTGPDGKRTPTYAKPVRMRAQVQALQSGDLRQLDGLNINGEKFAMYLNGDWGGVSRPDRRGGDLITLDKDGSSWLVALVLENWALMDGWCKVAVVKQEKPS